MSLPSPAPSNSLADLGRSVRRRGLLVLAVLVVAAGAAAAWAVRAPKKYRATATLLVERPLPTDLGIASPFATAQEIGRFAATQLQVLKSRAVLAAVEPRLDLASWPEFVGLAPDERMAALGDAIEVEPRGESALVDVSFVGSPFAAEQQFAISPQSVNPFCHVDGDFEFSFTGTLGTGFTVVASRNRTR